MKQLASLALLLVLFCTLCACGGPAEEPVPESTEVPEPYLALSQDGIHPQLVAHAGGAVHGYRLTNSLEALEAAYQNGFRYIELDFSYTSDGKLVLLHDWEAMAARMLSAQKQHTLEEFLAAETFAGLTLMDLDMLLTWLSTHQDCVVITDIKTGNDPFLKDLYTLAGPQAHQFIPQAYSFEDYRLAMDIGFSSAILTLYQMPDASQSQLVSFAQEAQPWAITIPEASLTESLLAAITAQGTCVYTHSVNDLSSFEQWTALGLTGIYTDYFVPAMWPY